VHKIAELITQDAVSSAAILRTANSALYGSSAKARSVQQAIASMGSSHASYVLASLLMRNAFPSSDKNALLRFWDTSAELALCAAYVAGEVGTVDRDEAHTYALFRDIGTAVLICKFADYDEASLQASAGSASNVAAAEKARFGTDHTQVGAGLARDWQLPEEMIEAIRWHHADKIFDRNERPIADASLRLIAIGALCDRIVDDYEGTIANDATVQLTARALSVLDLDAPRFADLQAEATELLDQMDINAMPTIRVQRFNPGRSPNE
jgi:putative nucleotidyltransferase with HDIG domain